MNRTERIKTILIYPMINKLITKSNTNIGIDYQKVTDMEC